MVKGKRKVRKSITEVGKLRKKRIKNKRENVENGWMNWLNKSMAIINVTLQLLDICRLHEIWNGKTLNSM